MAKRKRQTTQKQKKYRSHRLNFYKDWRYGDRNSPTSSSPQKLALANRLRLLGVPQVRKTPAQSFGTSESQRLWDSWNSNSYQEKICKNRQTRKEVLFAKGIAGKIKVEDAKWKLESYVRC